MNHEVMDADWEIRQRNANAARYRRKVYRRRREQSIRVGAFVRSLFLSAVVIFTFAVMMALIAR